MSLWNDLKNVRDETLDVVNPTKAASPSTEQRLRDVPLVGGPLIGSDVTKGYSATDDPGPNAPAFEVTGERFREHGVTSTVAGGAKNVASDVTPDLPDLSEYREEAAVVGGFLLLLTVLSSTRFNVGGGR